MDEEMPGTDAHRNHFGTGDPKLGLVRNEVPLVRGFLHGMTTVPGTTVSS